MLPQQNGQEGARVEVTAGEEEGAEDAASEPVGADDGEGSAVGRDGAGSCSAGSEGTGGGSGASLDATWVFLQGGGGDAARKAPGGADPEAASDGWNLLEEVAACSVAD